MLVVKIELWPGGREQEATEIGRAAIVNVSGLADLSDYIVIGRDEHAMAPSGRCADTGERTATGPSSHEASPRAAPGVFPVAGKTPVT